MESTATPNGAQTQTTPPTPAWVVAAQAAAEQARNAQAAVNAATEQPEQSEEISPQKEFRIVQRYLNALEQSNTRKGDPGKISAKLERVNERLAAKGIDPIARLADTQLKMDLTRQLRDLLTDDDSLPEAEADFVRVGASYANRKGISYGAWREIGVPAQVLRAAGITR